MKWVVPCCRSFQLRLSAWWWASCRASCWPSPWFPRVSSRQHAHHPWNHFRNAQGRVLPREPACVESGNSKLCHTSQKQRVCWQSAIRAFWFFFSSKGEHALLWQEYLRLDDKVVGASGFGDLICFICCLCNSSWRVWEKMHVWAWTCCSHSMLGRILGFILSWSCFCYVRVRALIRMRVKAVSKKPFECLVF